MELLTPPSHESGDFSLKPLIISVAWFPIAPIAYKNTMNMLRSDCVFLTVKCFNLGENEASH